MTFIGYRGTSVARSELGLVETVVGCPTNQTRFHATSFLKTWSFCPEPALLYCLPFEHIFFVLNVGFLER